VRKDPVMARQNACKRLWARIRGYRRIAGGVLALLWVALFVIAAKNHMVGVNDPMFSHKQLQTLGDYTSPFEHQPSAARQKVVFVLLDGMRFDSSVQQNEAFKGWLASIRNDSVVIQMRASLPSISVPNWLALVSGAPPEMTGTHAYGIAYCVSMYVCELHYFSCVLYAR
jgi:hypothetical protein